MWGEALLGRNRWRRRPLGRLLVTVVVLALIAWRGWVAPIGRPDAQPLGEGIWQVQRVVDGDTLIVERTISQRINGQMTSSQQSTRVRLMGVDTPETVRPNYPVEPWGPEASRFTKQFVAGGSVRLQLDKERLDKYGRLLAYVWVDERMLNEELLRAGLAEAKLTFRYSSAMKRRFGDAEAEAKDNRLGIWSGMP